MIVVFSAMALRLMVLFVMVLVILALVVIVVVKVAMMVVGMGMAMMASIIIAYIPMIDMIIIFYNLLRGVAGGELVIREDMALASISAGSVVEFSPDEMQQLLRRCVEEGEIMRSRGNIYFV